ncbi:MAG: zeta toxin family protein [Lacipirellulaceae bacterium]
MSNYTPRLRLFGGPNGSGKSTLKRSLREQYADSFFGAFLNADELESRMREKRSLDPVWYQVSWDARAVSAHLRDSPRLASAGLASDMARLRVVGNRLDFKDSEVNSYVAAEAIACLGQALMDAGRPFSVETVMSHPSKLDLIRRARGAGYRTYLYFVATDNPEINLSRVRNRARQGGHDVPEDKVRTRYTRSLGLLPDAIRLTSRAYVFDNSGAEMRWLAEITDGTRLELKSGQEVPRWFHDSVLSKMSL